MQKRGRGIDPRGYDCGEKGRRILVEVGLLLYALAHPADIQDCAGGVLVLKMLFGRYPFLKKLFFAGGYQGPGDLELALNS